MKLKHAVKYLLLIFLLWLLIHSIIISIDGFTDKKQNADIAVILGNKVNKNGSLSTRLKKRMQCGLELIKTGRVKKILVSGGFGKEGFYEAEKMKSFLIDNEIPDSVVIVDNYGNNTISTVKNTLEIKSKLNFNSIIVVSQYFHVTRTKMLFRKLGLNNVSSCCPYYLEWRDFYSVPREFLAFYVDLLFY
jgi:vancomycin permeability regulator SanA